MQIDQSWKVKIIDPGYKTSFDVYIFREIGGKREFIQTGEKSVILSMDGMAPSPTLSMDREMMKAFADALNDRGIKPEEGFLEGKLEATTKHLEDMRSLVFKKEKEG